MKNPIRTVLTALSALALTSSVFAVPYVDVQSPNVTINILNPHSGAFNLVNPGSSSVDLSAWGAGTAADSGGYVVGTDLVSATASFYFADDSDRAIETVSVFIGLFDGTFGSLLNNHALTTISFGASTISLSILETFGGINYSVSTLVGDFKLVNAVLTANTADVRAVPDAGATAVLFGMGVLLLSFFAVKRKVA